MPASLFGRYEIRQEIGRGGMAHVYLAFDPTFRREVAVKVLPPHYLENPLLRARFEREARLIATIEHPAIVPVYDFGEQDGQLYLVMRYMSGGSLVALIRQGPFTLNKASEILALLAPALDAVHARGIVHRDLKPGNILLDAFGNPALSDFGIAHLSEATVDLTGAAVIGTPAYMSPEQVRAEVTLDGRSDIYSLGIILFEMLTGRQPYQAATPMSIAMRQLTDPVPDIRRLRPDLPESLQSVLERALAKDREQRYPRAADLSFDVRAVLDASPPMHTPPPPADDSTQIDPQPQAGAQPSRTAAPASSPKDPVAPAPLASGSQSAPPPSAAGLAVERPSPPCRSLTWLWFVLVPVVCLLVLSVFLGIRYLLPSMLNPGTPTALSEATQAPVTAPATSLQVVATVATPDTPTPLAPTQTPAVLPAPVLFDDFSSPANGWQPQGSQDIGGYSYQDGAYNISVLQNDKSLPVVPDSRFSDLRITVEARRDSGDLGYYGVLCRFQDAENYYFFILRPDGYFEMGRYQSGAFTSLTSTSGGWNYDPVIQTGDTVNHLQAECAGDKLRFFVNGKLLWEASDSAFSTGKPGLVVAAKDDGGFQAVFDDFSVYSPVP